MAWHLTDSVDEFLTGAGDFLRARPVENTVLLTIADTIQRRGTHAYGDHPPRFGWRADGAFAWTPPRAAVLSDMPPDAVADLARTLAGTDLPAIDAPARVITEWRRRGDVTAHRRLYRLDKLTPPDPPAPGAGRIAGTRDRDLLIDWQAAFQRELGEDPAGAADFIDDKLAYGGMLLWEDDGHPVSMAGRTIPAAGMVRVQAVYTPREHRAQGYAGAVTTAVTQRALDVGATDVVLFTDLDNPTSNALYQRLGYTPVEDRRTVEFPS